MRPQYLRFPRDQVFFFFLVFLYLFLRHFHIWVQVEHLQQRSGAAFSHANNNSPRQPLLGGIMRGGGGGG